MNNMDNIIIIQAFIIMLLSFSVISLGITNKEFEQRITKLEIGILNINNNIGK